MLFEYIIHASLIFLIFSQVPFGEVNVTRDWLNITADVGKPESEHPKRPVLGFNCSKKEVSLTLAIKKLYLLTLFPLPIMLLHE